MSLDFDHHVLVGINILEKRKDVIWEDRYLPYIEGHQGVDFRLIDDREGKKFLYFGKKLTSGDKYEGIEQMEMDIEELAAIKKEVAEEYEKAFDEKCDESKIKLVACTVTY